MRRANSPRKGWRRQNLWAATNAHQVEHLESRCLLTSQLDVIDINPTGVAFSHRRLAFDDALIYTDRSSEVGVELFKYEPSTNTSSLLIDINPGSQDSTPEELTLAGSRLFFSAFDPDHGHEIRWIDLAADEINLNTLDVTPGPENSLPLSLQLVGDRLYFETAHGNRGLHWINTAETTPTLNTLDLIPNLSIVNYDGFKAVGTKLFFTANDPVSGNELRWIDTTESSPAIHTVDTNPGPADSYAGSRAGLTSVNNLLYFDATDSIYGRELRWIDTSLQTPTVHTIDVNLGAADSSPGKPKAVGNNLYFSARSDATGTELHWIDTTLQSPIINTIDLEAGPDSSSPFDLTPSGNRLYFGAKDSEFGNDVRWIDTTLGSPNVNTIDMGLGNSTVNLLLAKDNKLYFTAWTSLYGYELNWVATDTMSAQVHTLDLRPGTEGSNPGAYTGMTEVGNKLYFTAHITPNNYDLFWIDSTEANPEATSISIYGGSSSAFFDTHMNNGGFAAVGNKLFFASIELATGLELRWIDTTDPLHIVQSIDLYRGGFGSAPGRYGGFTAVGDKLYFTARSDSSDYELRWIDASLSSPIVNTIDIGNYHSYAGEHGGFTQVGDMLYFSAEDETNGVELRWIDTTDDVPIVQTLDLNPGPESSFAGEHGGFVAIGNKLYFSGVDDVYGHELRWIDTTIASPTVQTIDIQTGAGDSLAGEFGGFSVANNRLYFSATDQTNGHELRWIDTVAAPNAVQLVDINPGAGSSQVGEYGGFFPANNRLYFSALDSEFGNELRWISTSTNSPAITTIDINRGVNGSFAGRYGGFVAAGNDMYFSAYDQFNGYETRKISTLPNIPDVTLFDVYPGTSSSNAGWHGGFIVFDESVYFSARDPQLGHELRQIDTTEATPAVQTHDIYPGLLDSRPGDQTGFIAMNSSLYFSANTPDRGGELIRLITNFPPVIQPQIAYVSEADSGQIPFYIVDAADGESNLTFEVTGGTGASIFTIHPTTGALTTNGQLDYESTTVYTLYVQVTDAGGLWASARIAIEVIDEDEFDVTTPIDLDSQENAVPENSATDTQVGIMVGAVDADGTNNTISYSLVDSNGAPADAGGRFKIDSVSGLVTVADESLDYESDTSHQITVRATSSDDSTNHATFLINVLNEMSLDIDGNGRADATTDGILMVRYLLGFRGNALIDNAIAADATVTNSTDITRILDTSSFMLDADGNGQLNAATDGILIIRFLLGFTGSQLVNEAVGVGALRTTGKQVRDFLSTFLPTNGAANSSSASSVNSKNQKQQQQEPARQTDSLPSLSSNRYESRSTKPQQIWNRRRTAQSTAFLHESTLNHLKQTHQPAIEIAEQPRTRGLTDHTFTKQHKLKSTARRPELATEDPTGPGPLDIDIAMEDFGLQDWNLMFDLPALKTKEVLRNTPLAQRNKMEQSTSNSRPNDKAKSDKTTTNIPPSIQFQPEPANPPKTPPVSPV